MNSNKSCIFAAETNHRRLMLSNNVKEITPKSDVDLLVRYNRDDHFSLMTIARIMVNLEDIIKKPVDFPEE